MNNRIEILGTISEWGYGSRWLRDELKNKTGDVEVFISSFGGSFYEAIDMVNMLRRYAKEKGEITTIVGAKAMSAGAIIAMAGSKRVAHKNSTFMIHRSWQFAVGNAVDMEDTSKMLNAIDRIQAREFAKYLNESEDEVMSMFAKDKYYIGEDELKSTNIFTSIIDEDIEDEGLIESEKKANALYTSAVKSYEKDYVEKNHIEDFQKVAMSIKNCSGECPHEIKTLVASAETVPAMTKPVAINQTKKESVMAEEKDLVAIERKRTANIAALGSKYGVSSEAIQAAITEGKDVSAFQTLCLDSMESRLESETQAHKEELKALNEKLEASIEAQSSNGEATVEVIEENSSNKEKEAILAAAKNLEV